MAAWQRGSIKQPQRLPQKGGVSRQGTGGNQCRYVHTKASSAVQVRQRARAKGVCVALLRYKTGLVIIASRTVGGTTRRRTRGEGRIVSLDDGSQHPVPSTQRIAILFANIIPSGGQRDSAACNTASTWAPPWTSNNNGLRGPRRGQRGRRGAFQLHRLNH